MARPESIADTGPATPPANAGSAPAGDTPPAGPRFTAPDHVAAITLSTEREIRVADGMLTVPADLSDDERRQVLRAGFAPV